MEDTRNQQGSAQGFDDAVEYLFSILPSPLKISLTSADGRVNIPVPEKGDYVLISSASKKDGANTDRLLWLMGFQSNDQPSQTILLNEKNAVTLKKPQLTIREVNVMAGGTN